MNETAELLIERRRHRRFPVSEEAFVLCHPNARTPCRILDISGGGLAFCYLDGEKGLDGACEMDIFCCASQLCVNDIPFETVSDAVLEPQQSNVRPLRRKSVKFGALTPQQFELLSRLISVHAGTVP